MMERFIREARSALTRNAKLLKQKHEIIVLPFYTVFGYRPLRKWSLLFCAYTWGEDEGIVPLKGHMVEKLWMKEEPCNYPTVWSL